MITPSPAAKRKRRKGRITDRMRLNYLGKQPVETQLDYQEGCVIRSWRACYKFPDLYNPTIRQAIDAAIRAERAAPKGGEGEREI